MKKPSRSTLRNRLDKLCSEIVRARGRCERCGRTENLQCAHIISRANLHTRFYMPNLLCLCPNCHMNVAHKDPLLFAEWVLKHLGAEKYNLLREKSLKTDKIYDHDLEKLYTDLLTYRI